MSILAATLAIVPLITTADARSKTRKHHHNTVDNVGPTQGVSADRAGPAEAGDPGGGPYAGAGGVFSPNYKVPDPGTIRLGAQLLGGDFGKAYEDYYNHYYYYKYAYCPLGTEYIIYLRRCAGPLDLFR